MFYDPVRCYCQPINHSLHRNPDTILKELKTDKEIEDLDLSPQEMTSHHPREFTKVPNKLITKHISHVFY